MGRPLKNQKQCPTALISSSRYKAKISCPKSMHVQPLSPVQFMKALGLPTYTDDSNRPKLWNDAGEFYLYNIFSSTFTSILLICFWPICTICYIFPVASDIIKSKIIQLHWHVISGITLPLPTTISNPPNSCLVKLKALNCVDDFFHKFTFSYCTARL